MTISKKLPNREVSNPADYANIYTGEVLNSENKTESVELVKYKPSTKMLLESKDYITIDSQALLYLCNVLSKGDISHLYRMAQMLRTDCSILFNNNNKPHTTESLCKALDVDVSNFRKVLNRLVKKNVLAYAVCAPSGYVKKVYMFNPYVARKAQIFSCELDNFFSNLSIKEGQDKVNSKTKD
jgi:hypothetical protein